MQKIGIIGGNSFIGRQILKEFSTLNFEIISWGRKTTDFAYCFDYPQILVEVNSLLDVDFIFYTAGVGVQAGEKPTKENLYGVNTLTPINLINQLTDYHYKGTFISFGSYFEIGGQDDEVKRTEEEVINSSSKPINEYTLSKRLLSKFINDQLANNNGIRLMHLILPNVFGVGEDSSRLIPSVVKGVKDNKETFISSGTQVRQFLSVRDLTAFLSKIVSASNTLPGIYNLGSRNIMPVKELVEAILKVGQQLGYTRPDFSINAKIRKDLTAPYLALDDQKARNLLNWGNSTILEEEIKEYFND